MTVGTQYAATTWHLPKALLTRHSTFFAAALNGSFAEAKSNSVTMPDEDPNVFRVWVQWLFVGHIICEIVRVEDVNNVLVKGWMLGDKLGCRIFQNIVMTRLLASHSSNWADHLIEPSTLRAAYEGSAPGSMLRKWAIDFFLFETSNNEDGRVSAVQRDSFWISETKDIEDFSQDYLEASVARSAEDKPENPYIRARQYLVH